VERHTGERVCRCRSEPEKSPLQKNLRKLHRWLENIHNMDTVGLNVYVL